MVDAEQRSRPVLGPSEILRVEIGGAIGRAYAVASERLKQAAKASAQAANDTPNFITSLWMSYSEIDGTGGLTVSREVDLLAYRPIFSEADFSY